MKTLARIATPVLAAATALGLMATSASAVEPTVTIRRDDGNPYSGNFRFTNLSPLTVSASFSIFGSITAECSNANLSGTLTYDGLDVSLNSASVSGCTSSIGTASVSFEQLPYDDAVVNYSPGPNGRDGALTFTDTDLRVKATISLPILGTFTCYYGLNSSITSLTFDLYNPDNSNRPDASVNEAQAKMQNATLARLSGSNALCPATGTASGYGTVKGEKVANSGVFDQTLYATPAS